MTRWKKQVLAYQCDLQLLDRLLENLDINDTKSFYEGNILFGYSMKNVGLFKKYKNDNPFFPISASLEPLKRDAALNKLLYFQSC